jgi:methyltransferase (TIGR00027 family)
MVAVSRALASTGPEPLLHDHFAEPLVKAVGIDFFDRLVDDPALNQRKTAEGVAVRTRFFDNFFTDATGAGLRQAVILASGLDARAYRLAWPPGTALFEIDQPQVIEFKTSTLAELGATPAADLRSVAVDLRDDWPTALRANGFDDDKPTAWIAEGLLVYLPPDAQDRLFDHITALSAAGSRVATECVPDTTALTDKRSQSVRDRWRQYGLNVEVADLVYHGERTHVVEYLTGHGWQVSTRTHEELYAANGFTFPDNAGLAAFGDVRYVSAQLK